MKELTEIQFRLKAPKGQYNSFGRYKYRSQEDILEAVKPLLHEYGCTLTITDGIMEVGGRFYVKATARIVNNDGEEVATAGYAREEDVKKGMDASQITGAASSYARKYALNGLFCIDDTKDSDATNTGDAEEEKPQPKSEPKPQPDPLDEITRRLPAALKDIEESQTIGSLTGIYNAYTMLRGNAEFMSALTKKKYEIQNSLEI